MAVSHDDARRRAEAEVVNRYNWKYEGLEIDGPVFRVGGREFPINMISAEVIKGAATSTSRITLTRVIGGGLVAGPGGALLGGAAKKSTDTSKIYITVATPDGELITKTVPTSQEKMARQFADRLTSAASRSWPLQTPFGEIQLDPESRRTDRSESWVWLPPVVVLVASIILAFAVHGAFLFGILAALALWFVLLAIEAGQDEKALDATHPGWRERKAALEQSRTEEMWRKARGD